MTMSEDKWLATILGAVSVAGGIWLTAIGIWMLYDVWIKKVFK